jgi:uncharacterized membrane protein YhdT
MKRIKKKRTYRMYSADGYGLGSESIPRWKRWMSLPVILTTLIFTLITLIVMDIILVVSGNPSINMINDLPF